MAAAILAEVRLAGARGVTSNALREIPGAAGGYGVTTKFDNVYVFTGLSPIACLAIARLIRNKDAKLEQTHILVYAMEGQFPSLPVFTGKSSQTKSKREYWLPCVLQPT